MSRAQTFTSPHFGTLRILNQSPDFAARVRAYEAQGMTTSDAQSVVEAEDMKASTPPRKVGLRRFQNLELAICVETKEVDGLCVESLGDDCEASRAMAMSLVAAGHAIRYFWSVYGRLPEPEVGVECLCDCDDPESAELIYRTLRDTLRALQASDAALWDGEASYIVYPDGAQCTVEQLMEANEDAPLPEGDYQAIRDLDVGQSFVFNGGAHGCSVIRRLI